MSNNTPVKVIISNCFWDERHKCWRTFDGVSIASPSFASLSFEATYPTLEEAQKEGEMRKAKA